jgi:hypothetical protein
MLPSRVHAIVLVSKLHKPALRALAYARASRPNTLEAVTVNIDDEQSRRLQDEWEQREIPVPLKVLYSPYRETTRPLLRYVRGIRRDSPRDIVAVYIPEYVVGHWWEQLLHNQTALRLKTMLLFTPGVMVTSVPYQLASSEVGRLRAEWTTYAADDARRGTPVPEPSRPVAPGAGTRGASDAGEPVPAPVPAVPADGAPRGPVDSGIPLKPGARTHHHHRRRFRR